MVTLSHSLKDLYGNTIAVAVRSLDPIRSVEGNSIALPIRSVDPPVLSNPTALIKPHPQQK